MKNEVAEEVVVLRIKKIGFSITYLRTKPVLHSAVRKMHHLLDVESAELPFEAFVAKLAKFAKTETNYFRGGVIRFFGSTEKEPDPREYELFLKTEKLIDGKPICFVSNVPATTTRQEATATTSLSI